jgi:putative Mg2+ transporter-C (MgtC) family protein
MPLALTWNEIAIRLFCTVAAGALIGLNRSEHGRAAGLRTSILVCLAACVAMLQVNLLLPLAGRSSNSFVMNDLMRLPLGILSGMGFIGGGAILRRDNFVVGVTTAATVVPHRHRTLLRRRPSCAGTGGLGARSFRPDGLEAH